MPTKEITTKIKRELAFNLTNITTDTTTAGNIIDTADFDGGVNLTNHSGDFTDGAYTPLLEEGDDPGLSDAAAVDDVNLVAQDTSSSVAPETQAVLSADNQTSKLGYIGSKRFIRLSWVSASTSTGSRIISTAEKMAEVAPIV